MKILFIIPYTPTLIRFRSYNLLLGLLSHGHQVTLATLYESSTEINELDKWTARGATVWAVKLSHIRKGLNLLWGFPKSKPLQSVICWEPKLNNLINANILRLAGERKDFDIIHVEHLRGSQYGIDIQRWLTKNFYVNKQMKHIPVIWDSVDCISLLFERTARTSRSRIGRFAAKLDLPRTRRYEGWLVQQFDQTLITAEADKVALTALFHEACSRNFNIYDLYEKEIPITILPIGVDINQFTPNYESRHDATIVMTGKMSYHANITAALYLLESVMPHVWSKRPDVHVQIVGANPPPEIRGLVSRFPEKVEVTGTVPNMVPYLREATIAVAPITYGAGMQSKVLEAMACATPVVSSPQAVSALRTRPNHELIVGETPVDFADGIMNLLGNREYRQAIGVAGRKYVESHHSWDIVVNQLENIYFDQIRVKDQDHPIL